MADGGGLSPQTFSGSLCFQDRYGAVVRFTIHKVVIPARIALAASSFAGKRSCSAELRDNEIGGGGGNRTHSLNLARIGRPYDCHPLNATGRSCTRIFGVRSVALFSVELRQRKVEPRPGIAPGKCRFADDRVRLLAREAMVRRPGNAPGRGGARLFYRQPRLFTELSPRKWVLETVALSLSYRHIGTVAGTRTRITCLASRLSTLEI